MKTIKTGRMDSGLFFVIKKAIFKVLEPPPDLTLSQWADKYRRLSSESGSRGGCWHTDKAPWQRLHDFLFQKFKKADGTEMKIVRACMDTQGHFYNKVCRFCKKRFGLGLFAIRGGNEGTKIPYIPNPKKITGKRHIYSLLVQTLAKHFCFKGCRLSNKVQELENLAKRKGRNRIYRVVPRDL